jgi:hypothetical protein
MIQRNTVGQPLEYKGSTILVTLAGPDLLCYVDGTELPNFFLSVKGAHTAGKRYVDEKLKEAA